MNILQINASARRDGANSTRVANSIVARLLSDHPTAKVALRDFSSDPHPMVDAAAIGAMFTPAEKRTPAQAARMALNGPLIAELLATDVLVLGVPMYNFGIPAQLKNWIDAITINGETFRYTEKGPEGLVTGKKVYVGLARGGRYRDTATDSQVPYFRTILGFLGMTDLHFIYAEGLNMGPESAEQGFAQAEADIAAAFA